MDAKKLKIAKQKSESFIPFPKGIKSNGNLLQLDVENLNAKSLTLLVKESQREKTSISTQTDFEDLVANHMTALKDEFQYERAELEREFANEKSELEGKLRGHYKNVLEAKNKLINDLTKEKDFLWEEMKELRECCQVLDKDINGMTNDLEWDPGSDIGGHKKKGKHNKPAGRKIKQSLSVQDKEIILCSVMQLRKENLVQTLQREKQALLDKLEIEKDLIRQEIVSEVEATYHEELKDLHDTIEGLKDALSNMKTQKTELAKIFEGERNALEMGFARKEQEIKNKMELQQKETQEHQNMPTTKL